MTTQKKVEHISQETAEELLGACKVAWTKASNHERLSFDDCVLLEQAIAKATNGGNEK